MDYYFTVADVRLTIRTNNFLLPVYAMQHDVYRHFFSLKKQGDVIDEVEVFVTDAPAPGLMPGDKIFDSNSSLTVYSDAGRTYVIDRFPPYEAPVWVACIESGKNRVTIFCNPEIIDKTDNHLIYNPVSYPLDQILMMNFLASRQGAIIHAAGWSPDNRGFVFAGVSGAGKTTISDLIHPRGTGAMLSDDRVALRKMDDRFLMYGTPWPGEGGFADNRSVPLTGIFFLNQGNTNKIVDLKPSEAMPYLFPVMSIPWYDRGNTLKMLDFCESLMAHIPMYQLTFRADESAVDCIETML